MPETVSPRSSEILRTISGLPIQELLHREWLVTNGLGGYASGTILGAATRRYHGLLVAAHAAPLGRVMMLNHLTEQLRFPDFSAVTIGGIERPCGALDIAGTEALAEFRLEFGLPVWRYEVGEWLIEKRIVMPHQRNTVHIQYRLLRGVGPVRMKLRPSIDFRGHDDPVNTPGPKPYTLTATKNRYELSAPGSYPTLRLWIEGEHTTLSLEERYSPEILYRVERDRGYDKVGRLWSPGVFRANLTSNSPVVLSASTETWEQAQALAPEDTLTAERDRRRKLLGMAIPEAQGLAAELVLAADQFIITPATRAADVARAIASGGDARTIIAGYHWFTDWGRDTMISLDGLALVTGRHAEAKEILRTFARHVRDGLIPNYFPDKSNDGVYHTADATLWFFEAIHRYIQASQDQTFLMEVYPTLRNIMELHDRGTKFGIHVDPSDGLLIQGAEGYQLTWMDAKCGDWVVTPRRGKAVEINALWYNALRHMQNWSIECDDPSKSRDYQAWADRGYESFNQRFWCDCEQGLYDVIDGPEGHDASCRPNQIFAIALTHEVLHPSRWAAVVQTVHDRLLTPVGLRSLAPGHPEYRARYDGDLRARDAAYHQGTVWAWLLGPYIDAFRKAFPDQLGTVRDIIAGFDGHLSEACIGSVSEVFDAESPFTPRGCVAQAWSVAEWLRACVWWNQASVK